MVSSELATPSSASIRSPALAASTALVLCPGSYYVRFYRATGRGRHTHRDPDPQTDLMRGNCPMCDWRCGRTRRDLAHAALERDGKACPGKPVWTCPAGTYSEEVAREICTARTLPEADNVEAAKVSEAWMSSEMCPDVQLLEGENSDQEDGGITLTPLIRGLTEPGGLVSRLVRSLHLTEPAHAWGVDAVRGGVLCSHIVTFASLSLLQRHSAYEDAAKCGQAQ